jgi:hypothetical protein
LGNSYQVLAGPYERRWRRKQIYTALLSHGYKPRPFERGTRDFAFHSKVTIDGSPLPTGNFTVAWESYIADAKVKFTHGNDLVAAVDGTWVKHSAKFDQNEYVYQLQLMDPGRCWNSISGNGSGAGLQKRAALARPLRTFYGHFNSS